MDSTQHSANSGNSASPYYETVWDWDGTVSMSVIFGHAFFEMLKTTSRENLAKLTRLNPIVNVQDVQCILTARSRKDFQLTATEMQRYGVYADLIMKPTNDDHNMMGNIAWKAAWLNENQPTYYIDDDEEYNRILQEKLDVTRCISTSEYYLLKSPRPSTKIRGLVVASRWVGGNLRLSRGALETIPKSLVGTDVYLPNSKEPAGKITKAWVEGNTVVYEATIPLPLPLGFPHTPSVTSITLPEVPVDE